jgi:hypothetical protein
MSISGVGNGADLMGIMSQVAQGTTAQDASRNVLKRWMHRLLAPAILPHWFLRSQPQAAR